MNEADFNRRVRLILCDYRTEMDEFLNALEAKFMADVKKLIEVKNDGI